MPIQSPGVGEATLLKEAVTLLPAVTFEGAAEIAGGAAGALDPTVTVLLTARRVARLFK